MHSTVSAACLILLLASLSPPPASASPNPSVHQFQQKDARIVWTGGTGSQVEIRIEGTEPPTTVLMRDENGNWADMTDADGDWNNDRMIKTGYTVEPGNHVWFEFGWSVPKSFITETSCAYDHEHFFKDCAVPQTPLPPVDLQFDHLGGNEWWVELRMLGASVESLGDHSLWIMDDQGEMSFMTRLSQSRFGESMRIPIGTRAMFEATIPHREAVRSCWFVHNAGEEQCDGHKLPPWVRERREHENGGYFVWSTIERFEHFTINEWWVEVNLDPDNSNPYWEWERVEARVNGGTWKALTLRSWGSYAASFHVPAGSVLQFRAFDSIEGSWIYSTGGWTGAGMAVRHVPSLDPAWNVQFANVKGNNWWVQVNTYSDEFHGSVQARVEGGEWRDLPFREWGDWAASFHVPSGKRVQFQAIHHDGRTELSGLYTWPPPA